ncbi:MAG: IPT/TIG domain-containing protein [Acidobacteria bacterium]|nr:IPT/TIG domain-containing protein [Acidobacteriota bacterium]
MDHRRTRLSLPLIGIALTVAVTVSVVAAVGPVEQVLAAVASSATLDQVSRALAKAKLSEADAQRLAAALEQPPYAAKLAALRTSALAAAKTAAKRAADARTVELNRQAALRLAGLNRKASARMQALRTGGGSGAGVALRTTRFTPHMTALMSSPRPEFRGTITSVSPNPVSGGATLTVNGRDFGPDRGQVDLALLGSRLAVACPISSWSPGGTRVVVTVPAGIDALIQAGGEDARIWLRTSGQESGPLADIRVVPVDVPVITGVDSETIEPGQLLIVEGTGFGAAGQVRFHFPTLGQTQDGIVDLWTATGIVAHLRENLERMPREVRCELRITTGSGRTVTRELTFHATLAYATLHETEWFRNTGTGGGSGPLVFIQDLRNDWLVTSASATLVSDTEHTECSYGSRPATGSSHPLGVLQLRADGWWTCICTANLEIAGPKGTPWE